ncbi:hypothetical protein [Draconibacterium sediminis]|uniref:Uncharacterized protein n=1 Tax=Draconibacterium sediminis TaxID=1544798 RepID=A0A0D8J6E8_9BACT|nr:hypothetical protein [Draconibacterium sediminis]KJF42101.1 hypothetical protein LH29_19950 [Draconibacterium sediminis]
MTAHEFDTNLSKLTGKLKKEDRHYATIVKVVQIFYWIFIPLFMVKTAVEYTNSHEISDIISGVALILGFLFIALSFRKLYNEYQYVDYSLPTLEMLKKAVCRYQPFQKRALGILPGLLLMDVGLTFEWMGEGKSVLDSQLFFLGAILFGVIIGLVIWYFKYKPLRDKILHLVREIEQ